MFVVDDYLLINDVNGGVGGDGQDLLHGHYCCYCNFVNLEIILIKMMPFARLVYLPLISVHLLVFSSITIISGNRAHFSSNRSAEQTAPSTVDWAYLKRSMGIMIVPKLIGVFGLITLPSTLMSIIIFSIVGCYSLTYIFNKPFRSNSKTLDIAFLMLGAYISGTSLIGAPLIISVFANHVSKHQLRDTLFALWFILVTIKMAAFIYAGIDLQLIHHVWLLPCAAIGHVIGLRFHQYIMTADTAIFYRVVGDDPSGGALLGTVPDENSHVDGADGGGHFAGGHLLARRNVKWSV